LLTSLGRGAFASTIIRRYGEIVRSANCQPFTVDAVVLTLTVRFIKARSISDVDFITGERVKVTTFQVIVAVDVAEVNQHQRNRVTGPAS